MGTKLNFIFEVRVEVDDASPYANSTREVISETVAGALTDEVVHLTLGEDGIELADIVAGN